jgi:glyoxylase I family protein
MVLSPTKTTLPIGTLRRVHHIALNVKDMEASRQFYSELLGLHELAGDEVPETLRSLVLQGKVANFTTPDGTVLDLFWEPELTPANPDPTQQFTRANHLAFEIAPELFEQAVAVLHAGVRSFAMSIFAIKTVRSSRSKTAATQKTAHHQESGLISPLRNGIE